MRLFRSLLSVLSGCVLAAGSVHAQAVTEEDLNSALRSMGHSYGLAEVMTDNCRSEDGMKRIKNLRADVYVSTMMTYNNEDTSDGILKFLDVSAARERERLSKNCDEKALQLYLRGVERDFKDFYALLKQVK